MVKISHIDFYQELIFDFSIFQCLNMARLPVARLPLSLSLSLRFYLTITFHGKDSL